MEKSKNLEYVIFNSLVEAGKALEIKPHGINSAMEREGTAGGYEWYYYNSSEAQMIINKYKEEKIRITEDPSKRVIGLSKNLKYVIFNNAVEASRFLGFVCSSGIHKAIRTGGRSGDYKWYYLGSKEGQYVLDNYKPQQLIVEEPLIDYPNNLTINIKEISNEIIIPTINMIEMPKIINIEQKECTDTVETKLSEKRTINTRPFPKKNIENLLKSTAPKRQIPGPGQKQNL